MSDVTKLKSALAHVEQGATNANGAIRTADRIVRGVGVLVGETAGPESVAGRDALRWLAQATADLGNATAAMEMAARALRNGIDRVSNL
jgi:hypothetical protein